MSASTDHACSSHTWRKREQLLKRFEDAWQRGQPLLDDFVPPSQDPDCRAILIELVHIDLERRLKAGEPVCVAAYLARFPELARDPQVASSLERAESELRRRLDVVPTAHAQRLQAYAGEERHTRAEPATWNEETVLAATASSAMVEGVDGSSATAAVEATTIPPRIPGYEILGQLGLGGMGVVYKARDPRLKRLVALKMIRGGTEASLEERVRFRTEAEAVARLQHPNIVQVYDVGDIDGCPYLALEFVEGGSLDRHLNGTPQPPRQAGHCLEALAGAVHHAHQHGIIHRDLKPSNVLLAPSNALVEPQANGLAGGTLKITDFGLAKQMGNDAGQTKTGAIVGTPSYMAPEQAAGLKAAIGAAVDVYALGAILYELLTGRPPFKADNPLDTLMQVVRDEPVPPSRLQPKTPPDLETICLKCLQKEPARRYPTAQALAGDLRRFLDGLPIRARRISTVERAWRWCRRNPVLAGLAAAVLLSVLAGTIASGLFALEARQRADDAENNAALARDEQKRADDKAKEALEIAAAERAAKEMSRRHLYAAKTTLIRRYWEQAEADRIPNLLDRLKPKPGEEDLRGWEWWFQRRLCFQDAQTVRHVVGHQNALAWSPDGRRMASASGYLRGPGEAKVWDAATGRELLVLNSHTANVTGIAFSPDGKRLATASNDDTVKLWNADTGREVRSLTAPAEAPNSNWRRNVTFTPDGKYLAAVAGRDVTIWDAESAAVVGTLPHGGTVSWIAFSPDGRLLASASWWEFSVHLWDVAAARKLRSLKYPQNWIMGVAFSPNGRMVAAAGWGKDVKIWETETGRELFSFNGPDGVLDGVAFSPDGEWVAAASHDASVWLWRLRPDSQARILRGATSMVRSVAFSPDGLRLAAGDGWGYVRMWNWAEDPAMMILPEGLDWPRFAFRPDGRRVAASNDNQARVWDATTGQQVASLLGYHSVAYSPDGQCAALGHDDGSVRLLDPDLRGEHRTLKAHGRRVTSLTFSADGNRLATGSGEKGKSGEIKVWDLDSAGELHAFTDHSNRISSLSFDPEGRYLAATSGELHHRGELRVYNLQTGQVVHAFTSRLEGCYGAAFSPNGKYLAGANPYGQVHVFDVPSWQKLHALEGHQNRVRGVAFSPDSKRLASVSINWEKPSGVKIWDIVSGQEVYTIRDVMGNDADVAFSPDGHKLVTTGAGGTLRIYDGRPLTDEVRAEREAVALLNALFAKPLRKAEVAEYLRTAAVLRPEGRELALALLDNYREETDPKRYQAACWALVRQPHLNYPAYRFALWQARAACQLAPDDPASLTVLGIAQFRYGRFEPAQYREALITLANAKQRKPSDLTNLIFLAMTHHQAGQHGDARTMLDRLREVMSKRDSAGDEDLERFWAEAEQLISGQAHRTP